MVQGSPVKLILIRKPISHQPIIQFNWTVALFLRWCIGRNIIYCGFYVKVRFHAQNKTKVKLADFSSHVLYAFSFLRSEKNVRFAVREKVRFTFSIRTRKRKKISLWNFDMLCLHNPSFKRNLVCPNRITHSWEILVWSTKSRKKNSCETRFFVFEFATFEAWLLLCRSVNFWYQGLIWCLNSIY